MNWLGSIKNVGISFHIMGRHRVEQHFGDGKEGEEIAVRFLREKGYGIIQQNYIFGHGEIDIIARDGDMLVFVEVKSRASDEYGPPEDAVTQRKAGLVRRTAEGYLFTRKLDEIACRFDVIAIDRKGGRTEIRHLIDAF
jgi:putative endonuclease